jgi:hypothetical protein
LGRGLLPEPCYWSRPMRAFQILSGVLMSIAALCAVSCSSSGDSGNPDPVNPAGSKCQSIGGVTCTNKDPSGKAYTYIATCHSSDSTQIWYLVCTDADCTTGTKFDCPDANCASVTSSAVDACLPK